MTIRIWLFGRFHVEIDGDMQVVPEGKLQSLLAYLLLQPGNTQRREVLGELFWPDAEPERQRRNLSSSLYRLKQILGGDWIQASGNVLAIGDPTAFQVDAWDFDRLANQVDLQNLPTMLALYTDDLLPGIYDDWILPHRLRLREIYLNALYTHCANLEQAGDLPGALSSYEILAKTEPLREDVQRGRMRCLAKDGQLRKALEIYQTFLTQLAADLDATPARETQTLAVQLQTELDLRNKAGDSQPLGMFVGRIAERARLLTLLNHAKTGRGGVVVVLGEAGMGKTRLLEELQTAAIWRGWQVVWGRSDEFALPGPLDPLGSALLQALPLPRLQQLAQLLEPGWLAIVKSWLPSLDHGQELLPVAAHPVDRQQLVLALRNLLYGLQRILPHVIILDDVHWGEASLWPILDELRPTLAAMALLVVVSARQDELRDQGLAWSTLEMWDQAGEVILHLPGLGLTEMYELLDNQLVSSQVEQVVEASNGNPLLALELAQSGDIDRLVSQNLRINDLVLRRLTAISNPAQFALQAASVLGNRFDYGRWVAVLEQSNFPTTRMPEMVGEVERAGILHLEGRGYRFVHDTLRAAIYNHLTPAQKVEWHARALAALVNRPIEAVLALLHHAEQSGNFPAAASYALQAGSDALQAFSYSTAAAYFSKALNYLPDGDLARRFEALFGRQRALEGISDYPAQGADLELLEALAKKLDHPHQHARVLACQANHASNTGGYQQAQKLAHAALDLALDLQDLHLQAQIYEITGRAARELGDYPAAEASYQAMQDIYTRQRDTLGCANALQSLGVIAQRVGDFPAAIRLHTQSAELAAQTSDRVFEIRILSNLAIDYWGSGDYSQAAVTFERSLAISREIGDRRAEASALVNLGSLAGLVGDYEVSIALLSDALVIQRLMHNRIGVATTISNLATTYSNLGKYDEALRHYQEALALNRQMGRRRGEGYNLHGRGETYLELGMVREAREDFEQALHLRRELGERVNALVTLSSLAQVYLAASDLPRAMNLINEALNELQPEMDPDTRQSVHFAVSQILAAAGDLPGSRAHLQKARSAMLEIAADLPAEARLRFMVTNPMNRRVQAAWEALTVTTMVRLVRADTPLGRKLREDDYVAVTWSIHTPEDEGFASSADRRRQRLLRLLDEAAAQGAAPTDDDLAQALGVSRRTILRDLEQVETSRFRARRRIKSQKNQK